MTLKLLSQIKKNLRNAKKSFNQFHQMKIVIIFKNKLLIVKKKLGIKTERKIILLIRFRNLDT